MGEHILTVELPWPDSRLSPNARVHRMQKAQAAREARETAGWLTINARQKGIGDAAMECVRHFYPPDNRRRDIDNLGAMCKSYQDGIFDRLPIDDSQVVRVVNEMKDKCKDGKVVISLWRLT